MENKRETTELKVIEINNHAYQNVKRRALSYRNAAIILGTSCAILLAFCIKMSTDIRRSNEVIQSYSQQIEQMSFNLQTLQSICNYNDFQSIKKDDMIDTFRQTNDYVNAKIRLMQTEIDALEAYIDANIVVPDEKVTPHTDLAVNSRMDTETMNKIIDRFAEVNNTRFVGHGQAFIEASNQTGLDPVFILSLSCLEGNWGNSDIAINKNNFMGIGAFDSDPYGCSYVMGDTIDQGIIEGAKWVKANYYDQGQTSLHAMIYGPKMYSSSRDHWIRSICSLMNTSYMYALQN